MFMLHDRVKLNCRLRPPLTALPCRQSQLSLNPLPLRCLPRSLNWELHLKHRDYFVVNFFLCCDSHISL